MAYILSDEQLEKLVGEFEIIQKQMELIGEIPGVDEAEPMTFPFVTYEAKLREDKEEESLSVNEVLANAKHTLNDQVKVPKVVE